MESSVPPSLDSLNHLGLRTGVDTRPTLLRVLTDLYVQKLAHTPDEERHYTELALRLLDVVDAPTRMAVAERLARHLAPPLRVIQRLAGDLPEVAAPLSGHRLLEPAAKTSETIGAPVQPPAAKPVAQTAAPKQPQQERRPVERTTGIVGTDIASELNELFFAANASERRLILLNLEVVAPTPPGRIDITRDATIGKRLETAALARNRESFTQTLAQALHVPQEQALRIISDELGEPIIVAAKALNMARDAVYRMLLFVNTTVGHSVERVHALATLYDEITPQAAAHMVAIWQVLHSDRRAAPKHQPLHWDDDARARTRTATTTVRRAPAAPRTNERRDVS